MSVKQQFTETEFRLLSPSSRDALAIARPQAISRMKRESRSPTFYMDCIRRIPDRLVEPSMRRGSAMTIFCRCSG
jgi:hypothetical protein